MNAMAWKSERKAKTARTSNRKRIIKCLLPRAGLDGSDEIMEGGLGEGGSLHNRFMEENRREMLIVVYKMYNNITIKYLNAT